MVRQGGQMSVRIEGEARMTRAPRSADGLPRIHDQKVNACLLQRTGHCEPGKSSADDDHICRYTLQLLCSQQMANIDVAAAISMDRQILNPRLCQNSRILIVVE